MSEKPDDETGAVFGFDDLKALREEYEERIRLMKVEHEAQLKSDGASRQELITDLTFELAAAREEGEMRARGAEAKRASIENALRQALVDIDRVEAEIARVRLGLSDALSPTETIEIFGPPPVVSPDAPTIPPPSSPSAPASYAPPVYSPPAPAFARPSSGPVARAPMPAAAAEVVVQARDVVASAPAGPPPVPSDPTPASTAAGARRKKIRLR